MATTSKTNYYNFTTFGKTIELIKGDITDNVVDCILNLTNSTLDQSTGVSGPILAAAGDKVKEECKIIGKLNTAEIVVTSGGNTKAKHIMHIIGPTTATAYEPALEMILLECHQNQFRSLAIPAIGTGMACVDPEESIHAILKSILNCLSETFIPTLEIISIIVIQEPIYKAYLKVFQEKCEELKAHKREETIALPIAQGSFIYPSMWTNPESFGHKNMTPDKKSKEFEKDAAKFRSALKGSYKGMEEMEQSEGTHRQVVIDYPLTWTDIGKEELQVVTLKEDSQEYKDVKENFLKSCGPQRFMVVKIERIQNLKLFQSYTVKKQAVGRKNPGKRNVQRLYHGTASEAIKNINQGGFNRGYCGKNATVIGLGTYFAVASSYSCSDTYSVPDTDGLKYIYQASVITGRYCEGKSDYKEPPYINDDHSEGRYDSVTDSVPNGNIFAVFYDDSAYPDYLITFKPDMFYMLNDIQRCCIL